MIPVIIEDYISKLLDKTTHIEKRQFYYDTLIKVKDAINKGLTSYENERRFKK